MLPDNPADLKGIIADFSARNEAAKSLLEHHESRLAEHESLLADKEQYISQLLEEIRLLKALRYSARSEKASSLHDELQYRLFDEAEMVCCVEETEPPVDEAATTEGPGPHPQKAWPQAPPSGLPPGGCGP